MSIPLSSADVYLDAHGLSQLRRTADNRSDEALQAVAQQFEALFIQQMLKTMRDAKLADGLFDSDQSEFYTNLYDKQLAINLSKVEGMGLSELIVEQLRQNVPELQNQNIVNNDSNYNNGNDNSSNYNPHNSSTKTGSDRVGSENPGFISASLNSAALSLPHSAHSSANSGVAKSASYPHNAMLPLLAKLADHGDLGERFSSAATRLSQTQPEINDTILKSKAYNTAFATQSTIKEQPDIVRSSSGASTEKILGVVNDGVQPVSDSDRHSQYEAHFESPASFINSLWPLAQRAAQQLGVPPKVLLAQAALETGWGKAINQHTDGRSSHNLFNIKAGSTWKGESVTVSTLEYKDGLARREKALFRSYDSFQESFDDYVAFIKKSPRYQAALQVAADYKAYTQSLQRAGYATDPEYANKIIKIINGKPMENAFAKLKLSLNETISDMNGSVK